MNPRDTARDLISKHGLSEQVPVNLSALCRLLGIKVVFCAGDKLHGAAISGPEEHVILVNENLPVVRQRFTIAHEIGHLIMGHRGVAFKTDADSREKMELEANLFAGEILMPLEPFRRIAREREMNAAAIAGEFMTSESSVAIRLGRLTRWGEL